MIDIHCHILPGMDDGARTLDDSIEMARAAVAQGIHTIVATPHHKNNQFNNFREDILLQVDKLNRVLHEKQIPLEILPGQETRIYGDLIEDLGTQEILPVNSSSPYILIELPTSSVPKYTKKILYDLQLEGFTPIIVHPERNTELISNPEKLYDFIKSGVLSQVTAASLVGKFGKKIKKFSLEIVQSNLSHFIASDAHNVLSRGFVMEEALFEVEKLFGSDTVYTFMENANKVIKGETIIGDPPEMIIRKKFLRIF
ncbi:tyrosine-protein phosphatase [Terribacillus saccharophilus]|uniref:Tyrosine-protein phosphatase n=1 Tax=Terribacillus saccharophilus TaxID=361277 RepID=A0ABX4GXR5_9BACI|nr:CpsB/CapC family capsule biosynthesis tyrosine phosphatase [Terribacillus saccharophilus]PAD35269.1 tyrosine protein phosphatase [Terribacillus saccharophilus]PAD96018.1 tyrosine protein phosphatase [Terribacillus saccharophilus]PAD99658.1 tyrosine protein phosphatase [Terribacillus saccharophilus]